MQCRNHKPPNGVLLESFYKSLDAIKFVVNNVVEDSLINYTYEEASVMLDRMTKMNKAWNTREAEVVSSTSTQKLSTKEILKQEAKKE